MHKHNYNNKLQQVTPREIPTSFFFFLPLKSQFQSSLTDIGTGLGHACEDTACFKCVWALQRKHTSQELQSH